MRITWVTRSFLDYRIPLYQAVDNLCGGKLTVIYFRDVVPLRCQDKLKVVLGDRAIGLTGEMRIGGKKRENQNFANKGGIRISLRPGLIKTVKKTKPDVLLSDGFFQWTYAALWLRKWYKIPHVMCYERTLHTEREVSLLRVIMRKLAAKYIDFICANGIQTKDYLVSFGYPASSIILGNMVADSKNLNQAILQKTSSDIEHFRNKMRVSSPIFLYVGQLIERKGILEMIRAWKEFVKDKENATLILVGDGEQRKHVENYIQQHNLSSVIVTGRVDYEDVVNYYAAADIFIIPTLEDNWSLVVPEAMSCGLPIICSKYNGCWPELVKPENGWVFDPLNDDSFQSTLRLVWNKKDFWKAMGAASKTIVSDYTPVKVAKNIFDISQKLINH